MTELESERAFKNNFPDYNRETLLSPDGKISDPYLSKTTNAIHKLWKKLDEEFHPDRKDDSVYTGNSGQALLHLHMHDKKAEQQKSAATSKDDTHLRRALDVLKPCLDRLRGSRVTFICGDAGPLALVAVIYHKLGKGDKSCRYIQAVEDLSDRVCNDRSLPDEVLYGRCGYLTALLFLQKHLGKDCIRKEIVVQVAEAVLDSGACMAKRYKCSHPLMYEWHDKAYLGAAHGLVGIYFTLLQVEDPSIAPRIREIVRPCVDYMLTLRFPSGNGPSSVGSTNGDKLIHWCHGAPGWVHLFSLAYRIYKDDRYLQAAKDCAAVVWRRGLLTKGEGICHGTAGNAYTFLTMFQLTGEQRFLYYALKFAEWCCECGKHPNTRTPDRPLSMFEGLAGTLYFLVDIISPTGARFPAFDFR